VIELYKHIPYRPIVFAMEP